MSARAPMVVSTVMLVLVGGCASQPPPAATGVAAAGGSPRPAAAAAPAAPAAAPAAPGPPPARSVDAILADAVNAAGGDAAWNAHTSVRVKMEVTLQGIGITGVEEHFATRNDKALTTTELPGVGTIRQGSNAKVLWAQDPVFGLRLLEGAEAEEARIESIWNSDRRMRELYPKIEATTESGPNGVPLECLVLTPKLGHPTTSCYDLTTHLAVIQKGTRSSPQGDTPFLSVLKDWREVGGIKMAFSIDTQIGPLTSVGRIIDVKFDEAMDDKMFDPPAAQPTPTAPARRDGARKKPAGAAAGAKK